MSTLLDPPASFAGHAAIDPPLVPLPFGAAIARPGFPPPAEGFEDASLDLNRHLIHNAAATCVYRANGHAMARAGILDGDLLIVDRSVEPRTGSLVIAVRAGNQSICRILQRAGHCIELHSANPEVPPIIIELGNEFELFAVVSIARHVPCDAVPRASRS